MKITKELKSGIAVIVIITLFIFGINFAKGQNLLGGALTNYYARFDHVGGLTTASTVTVNGFIVGKVSGIEFDSESKGGLLVSFNLNQEVTFSKQSKIRIYSSSLMGGKSVEIIPSYMGESAKPGDYFKGELETDMITNVTNHLDPLQSKLELTLGNANNVMKGLNEILDPTSTMHLKRTIANLNTTMANFNQASKSLNDILNTNKGKLDRSFDNFEKITKDFSKVSQDLASANIDKTMKDLEGSMAKFNGILTRLEDGKGSVGKLLKDEELYNNLTNASKELEELLRAFKDHPKRFVHFSVFGKKDKSTDTKSTK